MTGDDRDLPDLLMLAPLADAVVAALERDFRVHRLIGGTGDPALIERLAPSLRHVATTGHLGCPLPLFETLTRLELIACFGVGYDGVDVPAAAERGIAVTNTPDVLNDCVAEVTLALMLALAHRVPQADRFVRAGRWPQGNFGLTDELTGARAGILGLGRIGKEIASRLEAFKMEVVYHGRSRQPDVAYRYFADLRDMAAAVDWLIVIAPGSPATAGIVDRAVLEALGPDGYLVNVARGSLVDETALIECLVSGSLKGAALDVFAQEPVVPEALMRLDNVVLMPHQASASHRTRAAMGDLLVRNLRAHLAGEPLLTPVG